VRPSSRISLADPWASEKDQTFCGGTESYVSFCASTERSSRHSEPSKVLDIAPR
jgi:hypothetical protein